jgi:cytochrome c oxidase subunit 4
MDPTNENRLLNAILALAALAALVVAGYNVFTGQIFSTGVDGLFMTLVCLMLALILAINPLLWLVKSGALKSLRSHSTAATAAVPNGLYIIQPEEDPAHAHEGASTRLNLIIWGWLLLITGIEVLLGYLQIAPPATMLLILMALSVVKAGLIVAYFMHLKFERMTLVLTVVPAIVICISLFGVFFPDSIRSLSLRAFH